jgi:type IV secretory pathway VirB10-like protein
MIAANTCLSELPRTVIMRAGVVSVALLLLCLFAEGAAAQQPEKRNDLDVTMQIIVDPDAKLPDEVVRRIPLPARKPADTSPAAASGQSDKSGKADTDKERDSAASEHGKESSEAAQERAREAQEQREAARRAAAEERKKRDHGPPPDRPDPPGRPPH